MNLNTFLGLTGLLPYPSAISPLIAPLVEAPPPEIPRGHRSSHMPLSSVGSYLSTSQEFLNHWAQANAALGGTSATDIKLPGGYTLLNMTTDRAALQAAITAVEGTDNTRQVAAANRDIKKAALHPRIAQFRAAVRHYLSGTGYVGALPRTPLIQSNESRFLKPFDDAANLWATLNAEGASPDFTPPLLLVGGYALAALTADLAALRADFAAVNNANEAARLNRKKRDVLLSPLRARLRQYREAVLAKFGPADPLTLSLPALSPPPGSTPAAVSVSGAWNATSEKADLTWTASPNPALDFYSVRTAPGPAYRADEESVVATVANTETGYSTDAGLAAPGSVALYKVYVVLTTGNERGSATVRIVRPSAG